MTGGGLTSNENERLETDGKNTETDRNEQMPGLFHMYERLRSREQEKQLHRQIRDQSTDYRWHDKQLHRHRLLRVQRARLYGSLPQQRVRKKGRGRRACHRRQMHRLPEVRSSVYHARNKLRRGHKKADNMQALRGMRAFLPA